MSTALALEVELQPEWRNVTRASEAVALLVQSTYGDDDLRDAIAMVSAELLENAIKYADPQTLVRLTIEDDPSGQITVSVTNAIVQPEEIQRLAARLDWLRQHPDPAAAWAEALTLAISGGERHQDRPGLGILRIAYEGGSRVDYDVTAPGTLTVRAQMSKAPANE
jgi:hypothetical protein